MHGNQRYVELEHALPLPDHDTCGRPQVTQKVALLAPVAMSRRIAIATTTR
jgi:hypothetical protein